MMRDEYIDYTSAPSLSPAAIGCNVFRGRAACPPLSNYSIFNPWFINGLSKFDNSVSSPLLSLIRKNEFNNVSSAIFSIEKKNKQMMRVRKLIDKYTVGDKPKDDRERIEREIYSIIDKIGYEKIENIPDDELNNRIKRIIALEGISGLLEDLSDAQLKAFEDATRRRDFFK